MAGAGERAERTRAGARCCLSGLPALPSSPPEDSSGLAPPCAPMELALQRTNFVSESYLVQPA